LTRTLLVLLLLASPALAQDKPAITPQRDVDVTYAIASPVPGGEPLTQRMRWSVGSGRLRVDPPAQDMYMVVDYRSRRMMVIRPSDRAVLDLDATGPGLPGAPSDGQFARQAAQTIAGLACTDWQTLDAAGVAAVICLTRDGVMLRASRDGQMLLQATSVSYAPQDTAAFDLPAGYRHITPPPQPPKP
jgi:hypothetical protein